MIYRLRRSNFVHRFKSRQKSKTFETITSILSSFISTGRTNSSIFRHSTRYFYTFFVCLFNCMCACLLGLMVIHMYACLLMPCLLNFLVHIALRTFSFMNITHRICWLWMMMSWSRSQIRLNFLMNCWLGESCLRIIFFTIREWRYSFIAYFFNTYITLQIYRLSFLVILEFYFGFILRLIQNFNIEEKLWISSAFLAVLCKVYHMSVCQGSCQGPQETSPHAYSFDAWRRT